MMMQTAAPAKPNDELNTADRCDACGAQAYVKVVMPYGELLFCGHHANQHLIQLEQRALRIQDERSRIR